MAHPGQGKMERRLAQIEESVARYPPVLASALAPGSLHRIAGQPRLLFIDALVHNYLNSVGLSELAPETQRTRKNILKNFGKEHGEKRAAKLGREHIVAMFTKKKDKRFAARNWLKTVRALMQFGIDNALLKEDPTAGIKNMSAKTDGFRSWDEDDIAAFEQRWSISTRERLAMASCFGHCSGAAM